MWDKIVIYHNRDFDGFCSAAIIKKFYSEADFIGWDYGMEIPNLPENTDIFLVDISFDMKSMSEISKKSNLFWIDHHISAIKEYRKGFKGMQPFNKVILNENLSACELTWTYFIPSSPPRAVKLLGTYDIWNNKDEEFWENEVLPFQWGMKGRCNSFETFPSEVFESEELVDTIIEEGKLILKYQRSIDEYKCKQGAYEREFEGLKAICLNETIPGSSVFNSIWDEDKYDIMISFNYNGKLWRVSLYTTKSNIDVSEICKKYGGGGHKGAAGFLLKDLKSLFEYCIIKRKRVVEYIIVSSEKESDFGERVTKKLEEGFEFYGDLKIVGKKDYEYTSHLYKEYKTTLAFYQVMIRNS